jgi:hypothetical protein
MNASNDAQPGRAKGKQPMADHSPETTEQDSRVGDPRDVWSGTDPKIGHVNPAEAVEHSEAEPAAVEALAGSAPEEEPARPDDGRT